MFFYVNLNDNLDDQCSTDGYIVFFGGVSFLGVPRNIIWVQILFQELDIPQPQQPIFWCDNIRATYHVVNPYFHCRTKYVEVNYHFICERVTSHQLDVRIISSKVQVVDIMTKHWSVHHLARFRAIRT